MKKEANIVRFTAEELAAMRARGEGMTDRATVVSKTDAQIAADTASDPAWDSIPEDWYKYAVARTGPLFRPKENKQAIHIRIDADVVDFFRKGGRGWQGRMNEVLRGFMLRQN